MAASSSKRRPKKKKVGSVAKELGAIHQWMKDHEEHDDKRFEQGTLKMNTLATKDDIQIVMVDQASKSDLIKLTELLLTDEGQPQFATKADMQPLLDLYKGSTFVKSFAAGIAGFVLTTVAVGYALIQLVMWIRGN